MTNRNTRTGKLPVLLIAFAVLAGFQFRPAEDQYIEQTRKAAKQGDAQAQYSIRCLMGSWIRGTASRPVAVADTALKHFQLEK